MSPPQKQNRVAELLGQMVAEGSWAGKTHIQKTLYLFQMLFEEPADDGYRYILYRHGPYSFELDEDLAEMEFVGMIRRIARPPYGPQYQVEATAMSEWMKRLALKPDPKGVELAYAARTISRRSVRELEALATIAYVESKLDSQSDQELKASILYRVGELKPHLTGTELERAFQSWRELKLGARGISNLSREAVVQP